MGFTVAPFTIYLLAWIAIIPPWILVQQKSLKKVILTCAMWGIGYHGLALFWITGIHPMTWMGVSWFNSLLIAIFAWFFITAWGASLVIFWGIIFHFYLKLVNLSELKNYGSKICLKILGGITIWCLTEKIWSYSPLWWSSISYTQSPYNLAILQFLKISGITTITALLILVNGLFAESLLLSFPIISPSFSKIRGEQIFFEKEKKVNKNLTKKIISLSVIIFISAHSIGYLMYRQPLNDLPENLVKVGIIQGNIPNTIKLYESGVRRALDNYKNGYEILSYGNPDLIITPETALPLYYEDIVNNTQIYQKILDKKIPIILGGFGKKNNGFTNSLFSIDREAKLIGRYNKVNLVPLGEYIPFQAVLGKIIDRLSPLDAHLLAGEKQQAFLTNLGKITVGICYESAYAEHFRRQNAQGGEFIITASNNAHYSIVMPSQHHAQDVMRAIEGGRWMARATNTGYSGIVDPHGNTIWQSSINEFQVYQGKIYRRQDKTLYVLWGDWLLKLLVIGLILSWFLILNFWKK
ncbi:MAG: apolipoprotein N-acyltransferase [Cyanobacterium sp. T60_A2020_053]|nr:apolipoprotein N-acyltransferase [Cyanobacterium sp. T60_A2020_053]